MHWLVITSYTVQICYLLILHMSAVVAVVETRLISIYKNGWCKAVIYLLIIEPRPYKCFSYHKSYMGRLSKTNMNLFSHLTQKKFNFYYLFRMISTHVRTVRSRIITIINFTDWMLKVNYPRRWSCRLSRVGQMRSLRLYSLYLTMWSRQIAKWRSLSLPSIMLNIYIWLVFYFETFNSSY